MQPCPSTIEFVFNNTKIDYVPNLSHWNLEGVENLLLSCKNWSSLNFSALWKLRRLELDAGDSSIH